MRKLISVFLVLIFVCSLTACNKNKNNNSNSVDIEYYAGIGVIPECIYKLGDNVSAMETEFQKQYEQDEHFQYNKMEGERSVRLSLGTKFFYYLKDKKEQGVSYIVTFEKAYGFELGTLNAEVENALSGMDYEIQELNSDNAFFMLGNPQGELIKCVFGDYTVAFVFVDDALCATAIYNTKDW